MGTFLRVLAFITFLAGGFFGLYLIGSAEKPYYSLSGSYDMAKTLYTLKITFGVMIMFSSLVQGMVLLVIGTTYNIVFEIKQKLYGLEIGNKI